MLVRQSARVLHQLREPRVILKLDLARAFYSISWPFLFKVLRRFGFGDRFLDWLAILLSSASTRVLINGKLGPRSGIDEACGRVIPCRRSCPSSPSTSWGA